MTSAPVPSTGHTAVRPTAGAPRLNALPGLRRPKTDPPQVLETERYDTDDRRLAAAEIALAVRRGDPTAPAQWQLDLPDGTGGSGCGCPFRRTTSRHPPCRPSWTS